MSGPAPTPPEPAAGNDNSWIYWTIGAVVIVLTILGLITFSGQEGRSRGPAEGRAAQPEAPEGGTARARPGHPHPDAGHRRGKRLRQPRPALGKALLNDQITNGADFVGRRPIIIDRRIVLAEALILQTYCPDKVKDYQDKIDDLKYDNTLKE